MFGSWLLLALGTPALGTTMPPQVDLAPVLDSLEVVVPAANRVDAAMFAPELYEKGLSAILGDGSNEETDWKNDEEKLEDLREGLDSFRKAEEVARREGPAIIRNARLRFDAVRSFAEGAGAREEAGDGYAAARALAARAESLAADPSEARLFWEAAIDSLNSAMSRAERMRAARIKGTPAVPYTAYDVCPFEGCCYRTWFARRDIVAYERPDERATVAFRIRSGMPVNAVMGVLIVSKLGSCRLDTRPASAGDKSPGDPIILLGNEGEGLFRALDRGKIVSVPCNMARGGVEPRFVWWSMVQRRDGRIGWVAQADEREETVFANQDWLSFSPYDEEPWCQ